MKRKRATMFGLVGAMAMLLTGCAQQYAEESNVFTGMYGPGFDYRTDGYGGGWYSGSYDIYVGRTFEAGATAICNDSYGNEATWYGDLSISTGELPPGLEITSQAPITIGGVPTRAGTWYLTVVFSNLSCDGIYYDNVYQNLTIKTTGS